MAGNTEIFKELSEIKQILARVDERSKQHDTSHADHEKRLRVLEDDKAKRNGIMAAVSFFASFVGAVLMWAFNWIYNKLFCGGAQ